MTDNDGAPRDNGARSGLSGLLMAVAAMVAAAALLIYALAYAGIFDGRAEAPDEPQAGPVEDVPADVDDAAPEGTDEEGAGAYPAADEDGAAGEGEGELPEDELAEGPGEEMGGEDGEPADPEAYPGVEEEQPEAAMPGRMRVIVDDFSAYPDEDAVADELDVSSGGEGNRIELSLLDEATSPGGPAGLRVDWTIVAPEPDDHVGAERYMDEAQDWSGARRLAVMADPSERSDRHFVVQFREQGSKEVWRHQGLLSDIPADGRPYSIPLDEEHFARTDWSGLDDEAMQIDAVDYYGIYVGHTGPGEGVLRIGTIWVDDRVEE